MPCFSQDGNKCTVRWMLNKAASTSVEKQKNFYLTKKPNQSNFVNHRPSTM